MKRAIFISLFLIGIRCAANGQDNVSKQEIIGQLRDLRTTIFKVSSGDNFFQQYRNKCRSIINGAIINIDSHENSFPYAYQQSIGGLIRLAQQMSTNASVEQDREIRLIYTDLMLKFGSGESNINAGEFVRLITVVVYATKGAQAANYLRVNYCPVGYDADYQHPCYQFTKLTSRLLTK
jgi:hypothetical protein